MNLPLHRIHDVVHGYGRLLIPLGRGRWLAWFDGKSLHSTSWYGFHNCSRTGIH